MDFNEQELIDLQAALQMQKVQLRRSIKACDSEEAVKPPMTVESNAAYKQLLVDALARNESLTAKVLAYSDNMGIVSILRYYGK
jgi:hypothetical protein